MSDVARRLQRLELLARVIDEGISVLPWCGKLALQKLVYTVQAVFGIDLGYRYGLHQLGPYSPELADDLGIGESAGRWSSRDDMVQMADGTVATGKRFTVGKASPFSKAVTSAAEERWSDISGGVRQACLALKGLYGRDLELIATLHYLQHVQEVGESELPLRLQELKPKFSPNEIQWGLDFLRRLENNAAANSLSLS